MALRDLIVLAVLLSCLLALHQVMEAMITDYTCLDVQRPRLGAFFGSMTTWIVTIIENHTLQAWLYAIYWRAKTLLHYRVNTMKTVAKT